LNAAGEAFRAWENDTLAESRPKTLRELSKLNQQLLNITIERSLTPIELGEARRGPSDASTSIEAGQRALGGLMEIHTAALEEIAPTRGAAVFNACRNMVRLDLGIKEKRRNQLQSQLRGEMGCAGAGVLV